MCVFKVHKLRHTNQVHQDSFLRSSKPPMYQARHSLFDFAIIKQSVLIEIIRSSSCKLQDNYPRKRIFDVLLNL